MATPWTTLKEHWPHATYQQLPEAHITAGFNTVHGTSKPWRLVCIGQENPWHHCSQNPCLLHSASHPLFEVALPSEKSGFYWYSCCCVFKLPQVPILNTCLAKVQRSRLLSAHLSFLHLYLAGSSTPPGGAPGTCIWGWEMLYILLLKCHSAVLHHAGLSKHFCCNGLCRAGEDLKLLLTAVWTLWFMLGYVIPTVHYCTLKHYWNAKRKSFPFFFPTQKMPTFWRTIQKGWLMKLMRQEAGFPLSLSNTVPCQLVISPVHYTDCRDIYSQLGSDPCCTMYPTINVETLTLSWENTRKTTGNSKVITSTQTADANGQIAEEKKN